MSPTLRRGFSDEIGSWKIICMRGRTCAAPRPCSSVRSLPVEQHRPRRRAGELHDGARRCVDLPQPDSPTSAERLASADVEADVGDRVDLEPGCARRGTRPRGSRPAAASRRRVGGARCRSRPSGTSSGARLVEQRSTPVAAALARARRRPRAARPRPRPGCAPTRPSPRVSRPGTSSGTRGPARVARDAAAAPPRGTCPARTGSGARTGIPAAGLIRSAGGRRSPRRRVWLGSSSFGIELEQRLGVRHAACR